MDLNETYTLQDLKQLAIDGELHFEQTKLLPDFFTPISVTWDLEKEGEDWRVSACLKVGKRSFALAECEHLGRGKPHWLIKKPFLRVLPVGLPWKALELAHREALVDADEARALVKLLAERELECRAAGLQLVQESLPLLRLQDRKGAFAQLWVRRGEQEPVRYTAFDPQKKAEEAAWEADLLETDFQRKATGDSDYYCPVDKVAKSLRFLLECGWRIEDYLSRQVHVSSELDLSAKDKQAYISFSGRLRFADYEADLKDVVGAFNRRDHFVQLSPHHVGLLSDEGPEQQLATMSDEVELCSEEVRVHKGRFAAFADALSDAVSLEDSLKGLCFGAVQEEPGVGADFVGELRPYQLEGLRWLDFLRSHQLGGVLADDMGLGKTVQIVALLSRMQRTAPVLILVPRSLIFHWKKEIERFLPSAVVRVHHGSERSSDAEALSQGVTVSSYGMLLRDAGLLQSVDWDLVVLDEAQAIKNSDSQTAKAVFGLRAACRVSVTGTPIENRVEELWSQYRFALPGLLDKGDLLNLERVKRRIQPFLMRRTKDIVATDLPPKTEQLVWLEMEQSQRELYESFVASYRQNLVKKVSQDGLGSHRMEVFEAILRLRQICCHPLLAGESGDEPAESAKLKQLMRDLRTVVQEGRKVLVYSQFTSMLNLIEGRLAEEQLCKWVRLDGSTRDREAVVDRFQSDEDTQIFLVSLKAGGTGLNLTAADYVFIYDPWWNEAVENQAIDRAHRIGRVNPVIAKRYVMSESVEEKMIKLKESKTRLSGQILDIEGEQALSAEELLELLS